MTLYHRSQRHLYGCMYHALYALTGDESWLEHVDDLSEFRWLARLHASDAVLLTYFADQVRDTTTPPEFWDTLRANVKLPDIVHLPLLVTIAGRGSFGRHVVAIALPVADDSVWVSDSALDGLRHLSYAEFLQSEFARAYMVQALAPAGVEHYPHESGAEYVSQTDTAPYAPI